MKSILNQLKMKINTVILNGHRLIRKLVESNEDFNQMIKETKDSIKIAFDTENSGMSLNQKYATPAGFSISVDGVTGYYVPLNHKDIKTNLHKRFKELLVNKKLIIMWNAVYDGGITSAHYDENLESYKWYDCMIAQHLLDAWDRKGLKYNTEKYFGIKQQKFSWENEINKAKAEDVYMYACDDAIFTFKHYLRTKEEIKEQNLSNLLLNIEGEFLKVLVHMKLNGITFDTEGCKLLENKLLKDREDIINKMLDVTPQIKRTINLVGDRIANINFDSPVHLKELLYDKLGLPVTKQTPTGAPAIDLDSLKAMKDSFGEWLHPICPLLIKYKEIQKLLSAYTKSLYEKVVEGKIYGDLLDHGTESGRLSAREPNLQQLPKNDTYKVRGLFTSSPGYKMMVADFSQEEYRLAGVLCKCQNFYETYNEGLDLHLNTANICYNLNIPKEGLNKNNPEYKTYESKFHKDRFNAKTINFGLLYGMSAFTLASKLGITDKEAKEIYDNFFNTNFEIKQAMENTSREIKVRGYIENMYGRRRRFNKITKGGKSFYPQAAFREGFNHKIQGWAADILRVVMIELYKYVREVGNDEIRILTTVHDEIMFEIKDNERFDIHVKRLVDIMENSVKLPIKLECEFETGYNYGECK